MTLRIELEVGEVHLWWLALDQPAADLNVLNAIEKERARRLAFEHDRRRFVSGRCALREVLSAYTGADAATLSIGAGLHGKPVLSGCDANLSFNLSHSGNIGMLAIGRVAAIGVDVEQLRAIANLDGLAAAVLTATECIALTRVPAEIRHSVFLCCWTRKEAVLKALGVGMSVDPRTIEVGMAPVRWADFAEVAGIHVRRIACGRDAVAAIAMASPVPIRDQGLWSGASAPALQNSNTGAPSKTLSTWEGRPC